VLDAGGKATFATADDTLLEKVATLDTQLNAAGSVVAWFEDGGNTYVFINVDSSDGDGLIKLTGVTGLTDASITSGALTFL
jgi:hypothetical protein